MRSLGRSRNAALHLHISRVSLACLAPAQMTTLRGVLRLTLDETPNSILAGVLYSGESGHPVSQLCCGALWQSESGASGVRAAWTPQLSSLLQRTRKRTLFTVGARARRDPRVILKHRIPTSDVCIFCVHPTHFARPGQEARPG